MVAPIYFEYTGTQNEVKRRPKSHGFHAERIGDVRENWLIASFEDGHGSQKKDLLEEVFVGLY